MESALALFSCLAGARHSRRRGGRQRGERFLGPKGGLSEAPHSVYSTSVALMAFKEASTAGRYDRVIKGGQEYLKTTQWDEGEGKRRDDPSYGG
jgi:squalene-hopene/tetraprenyl-beta-curcumene cyclase